MKKLILCLVLLQICLGGKISENIEQNEIKGKSCFQEKVQEILEDMKFYDNPAKGTKLDTTNMEYYSERLL
jgi:hypothetical protein